MKRLIFAALLCALGATPVRTVHAEALLLPTLTPFPNTFFQLHCDGLSVVDVASMQVQRHYADLGCVEAIAGAGATRAVAVLHQDTDLVVPQRLAYLDLVRGSIVDELELPPGNVSGAIFLRMLDESRALVVMSPYYDESSPSRLLRADRVNGHWQLVADVTVAGHSTPTGSGDTLTLWRLQPGGLRADLYRVDDLAYLRSLDLADATTGYVNLVFHALGRIHVVRDNNSSDRTLRAYDATSGALLRTVPWPYGYGPSIDIDAAGRLRTQRTVFNTPGDFASYRTQIVSVDLGTDTSTVLAEGPSLNYGLAIAHLGDASVVFEGTSFICFNVCLPSPTAPYVFKAGATLQRRALPLLTGSPNSAEFLVPSFIAGGTAAEVPALDRTALWILAGVLMLAARVRSGRSTRASRATK